MDELKHRPTLVSLSGGLDSTTLLELAIHEFGNVDTAAIGFTYGSKHNPYENSAAIQIAKHYNVPFELIDLSPIMANFKSALLKSGPEVPEGYYAGENMRQTVVPARNLIFISVLSGIAWSRGFGRIAIGAHAGDHFIYPDCRPDFMAAAQQAVALGSDGLVELWVPFLNDSKEDILARGLAHNVPYQLTRTCYKEQPVACGKCGSCRERLAAFQHVGATDPLEYEFRDSNPDRRDDLD